MTKQESFKRRVRARMEKTGERYVAARRALIEQADRPRTRTWVAEPEVSDRAVIEATCKSWDQWCNEITAWANAEPEGPITDHTAIAAYLQTDVKVGPVVGADGDGRLRTHNWPSTPLSAAGWHVHRWQVGHRDHRRGRVDPAKATAKPEADQADRYKVSVSHEKLPTFDDVETWKHYWTEWLEAIDEQS